MQGLPIGLDLGTRRIRAVQLNASGVRVRRVLAVLRPAGTGDMLGDDEACGLADAIDRAGFLGVGVRLVAPRAVICSSVLDLPPRASGAPIDQIAMGELAGRHRLDPDRTELAMWATGEAGSRNGTERIIAVACAHDRAEAFVAPLERAGLRVETIVPPAIALLRSLAIGRSQRILLDLGWSSARVLLMRDGVVIFERTMQECGISRLFDRAGEACGVTAETCELAGDEPDVPVSAQGGLDGEIEAYCKDIRRGLDEAMGYGARAARIESSVELCGGGAMLRSLRGPLERALGSPPGAADLAIQDQSLSPAFGSALGAARSQS
jgi:hypothetical protein